MIPVVVDTNVFISALVFGGNPRQVVRLAEAQAYALIVSEAIREETERVLLDKFDWAHARVRQACEPIWDIARTIIPQISVTAADDPDDNRILECAVEGRAAAIVTGDRDLLRLVSYEKVEILTPAEFLRLRIWQRRRSP